MQKAIVDQVNSTLKRLEEKDPGLKQMLKKAYGYVVFPSVGKASLVVGGSYGKGAVFEKGKLVGYATIGQTTLGVQIGGDTFSEVIAFENREAMERFKKGTVHFAANASAVLVKAGASGTSDYEKGVMARAYSRGGMLLELAIGGQKFTFKPKGDEQGEEQESPEKSGNRDAGKSGQKEGAEKGAGSRSDDESGEEDEASAQEEGESEDQEQPGLIARAAGGARKATAKVVDVVKEHPVAATLVGVAAAAGIALLVASLMGGGEEDDEQSQQDDDQSDESADSDEDSDAQMSADESDEDQEEERQDDDESHEGEESGRLTRSR